MELFAEHLDPDAFLMIEPAAGQGPFLSLMPRPRLCIDPGPQCAGALKADLLEISPEFLKACTAAGQWIAVIGNPPLAGTPSLPRNSSTTPPRRQVSSHSFCRCPSERLALRTDCIAICIHAYLANYCGSDSF